MASFFKKKGGQVNAANVQMTEAEAALAQSDFNIEKITELQNKFTGGAVLLVPGRIFIREGTLWKMCRRGPKKRHFILFNDILVYCTTVANRYSQQHILPLSQMSVSAECFYQPTVQADFDMDSEVDEQLDVANAFQVSHSNKSFHVFALSAADKANWLVNLNKHIARANQSILNDSEQQLVTRPVWVPDAIAKECMLCKTKFTPFVRKHHCRRCGRVVCSSCSPHRVSLNDIKSISVTASTEHNAKLERACKECFKAMTSLHRLSSSQGMSSSGSVSGPPSRPSDPPKRVPSTSSNTKPVSTALPGIVHDSSTDTEDSDDSADEQDNVTENLAKIELEPRKEDKVQEQTPLVEESCVKDEETPVSEETPATDDKKEQPGEAESMPTPPPRKKKLKKQLQQQLQKRLDQRDQQQQEKQHQQPEPEPEPEPEEENQSAQQEEEEEKPHGDSPKNVHSEDSNPVNEPISEESEINTPKKSRRKNKYVGSESTTTEAIPEGETDETTKDDAKLAAEDSEVQPSPTQKRARGRRQKFKAPTETD